MLQVYTTLHATPDIVVRPEKILDIDCEKMAAILPNSSEKCIEFSDVT